jgi:hypothetical protein
VDVRGAASVAHGMNATISGIRRSFQEAVERTKPSFTADPLTVNLLQAQDVGTEFNQFRSEHGRTCIEPPRILVGIIQAVQVVAGDDHGRRCPKAIPAIE